MHYEEWSLHEELLALLAKWYLIAGVFLVGSLIAWVAGLLLPPQFEARANLNVSFNSDAIYLTPDDYKNWQVEELEDFVLSSSVLAKTLDRLQKNESDWNSWNIEDIRQSVIPQWRTAGIWELVATTGTAQASQTLAATWRSVILEETKIVLEHAVAYNNYDRQLDAKAKALEDLNQSLRSVGQIGEQLESWLSAANESPLSADDLLLAFRINSQLQNLRSPRILSPIIFPDGQDADAYIAWAAATLEEIRHHQVELGSQRDAVRNEFVDLNANWLIEREAARGFSAYLQVEMHDQPDIKVARNYNSNILAVVGGFLTVISFLVYRIIAWTIRSQRAEVL